MVNSLGTGDHSFKHGCFPIYIQYLTTALKRILFRSVVMVLAFQPGGSSVYKRVLGQAGEDELAQSPNATSSNYFLRNSRHTDISYDASCI